MDSGRFTVDEQVAAEVAYLAGAWAANGRLRYGADGTPWVEVKYDGHNGLLGRFQTLFGGTVVDGSWRMSGASALEIFFAAVLPHVHTSKLAVLGRREVA